MVVTVGYRIEKMINDNEPKTFFNYYGEDIMDVVCALQRIYEGRAVVSRTPGGIVSHQVRYRPIKNNYVDNGCCSEQGHGDLPRVL